MSSRSFYTPMQIFGASLLGGPLAGGWFISRNFLFIGDREKAKNTNLFCWLFVILLGIALLFVPDWVPQVAIPLFYSSIAMSYADHIKKSSVILMKADDNMKGSSLRVVFVSLLFLLIFFATLFPVVFVTGLLTGSLPPSPM